MSPADLCCHTLLIDNDTRHQSYYLLLLSRVGVDEDDLRDRVPKYRFADEIDTLLQYLETHGNVDNDRLPEWTEFQKLVADYEVRPPQ